MENVKPILLSKTFWFNLLMAVVIVVQQIFGVEIAATEVEAIVTVLGNIVLRFFTNSGVSLK